MKLRNFFVRHDALLTVIGAIIVVGSYFVKDVFKDQAEKSAEEISEAESEFNVRSDMLAAKRRLDTIERVVRGISVELWSERAKKIKGHGNTNDPTAEYSVDIYEEGSTALDAVSRLVESVPEKRDFDERLDSLNRQLDLLHTVNDDVEELTFKMRFGAKKEEIEALKENAQNDAAILEAAQAAAHRPFQLAVADLWSEVLPLAEEQQKYYKLRAKWWKYASIVLFCVASVLALAGKLFGAKKEDEAEIGE
jgi:hypothetical protein